MCDSKDITVFVYLFDSNRESHRNAQDYYAHHRCQTTRQPLHRITDRPRFFRLKNQICLHKSKWSHKSSWVLLLRRDSTQLQRNIGFRNRGSEAASKHQCRQHDHQCRSGSAGRDESSLAWHFSIRDESPDLRDMKVLSLQRLLLKLGGVKNQNVSNNSFWDRIGKLTNVVGARSEGNSPGESEKTVADSEPLTPAARAEPARISRLRDPYTEQS